MKIIATTREVSNKIEHDDKVYVREEVINVETNTHFIKWGTFPLNDYTNIIHLYNGQYNGWYSKDGGKEDFFDNNTPMLETIYQTMLRDSKIEDVLS